MIRPLTINDISSVAELHKQELPGFLSELGSGFLNTFYLASFSVPIIFTFVLYDENKLVGFVTGTKQSKGLLKVILKTLPLHFFYYLLIHFITHPDQILKVFRVLRYPGLSDNNAELLTIAVNREYHKKGVGKQLLETVLDEFRKRNISSFKVSVYDRLEANGFYRKMGFRFIGSFDFLGEKMNYYEYKIR